METKPRFPLVLACAAASLILTACSTAPQEEAVIQKPAAEILDRVLALASETTNLHGGTWTLLDGTNWDPADTSGYVGQYCDESHTAQRYSLGLLGPAVKQPEKALEEAAAYFKQQGFTEDNRFESTLGDDRYLVFSLVAEDTTHIVYKPGTHGSALTIDSQCTTDPAMDEPTG
jgi:hypothetical protein